MPVVAALRISLLLMIMKMIEGTWLATQILLESKSTILNTLEVYTGIEALVYQAQILIS